jgi:hypothetical protein
VHYINKKTFLNLENNQDIKVDTGRLESPAAFTFYCCHDEETYSDYILVKNQSEETYLLHRLKQFNCFLVVMGGLPERTRTKLISGIRSIAGVIAAIVIDQKQTTDLGLVLEDIELHFSTMSRASNDPKNFIRPEHEI